ncbi:MAG: hypothetical protein QOI83_996, partial [Streptomycetaceae bacterium]|nr:hypothetical protein [Streptomycetaceae bacterium]
MPSSNFAAYLERNAQFAATDAKSEAKTYRVTPHSAATKTDLRPIEELDAWRARDPILRLARVLHDA